MDKPILTAIWQTEMDKVEGYHIHIYHDDFVSQFSADNILTQLQTLFPKHLEANYKIGVVGPHLTKNIQIDITKEGFAEIVQWLQMNNSGLSILVHPETGDDAKDHLQNSIWINKELGYNMEFFKKLGIDINQSSRPPLPNPNIK
jgi:aromatic ring-cleaving dioxygenase